MAEIAPELRKLAKDFKSELFSPLPSTKSNIPELREDGCFRLLEFGVGTGKCVLA